TPVPAGTPTDVRSGAFVAELGRQIAAYGPWIATDAYTAPVYTVPADQPRVPVILDAWQEPLHGEMAAGVPLPPGARGSAGSDGSAIVWQPATDTYWELWRLRREPGRYRATFGGIIHDASRSSGVFSRGTGVAASGLALLGGMIRPREFAAGAVDHALRMGIPQVTSYIIRAPANRTDGRAPGGIPMGTRFQLDPALNLCELDLPSQVKTIASAAQRYGLIVGDSSGAVALYAEDPAALPSNPWPDLLEHQSPGALMRLFPWNRLRVVPPG
ncbi:MAG: hypothetical protein JWM73_2981, partial [Solirubrobacterales bacterium]|nr:hypothetical protein [Solirubrobacterales bacterium]